jgi:hypothetical protein
MILHISLPRRAIVLYLLLLEKLEGKTKLHGLQFLRVIKSSFLCPGHEVCEDHGFGTKSKHSRAVLYHRQLKRRTYPLTLDVSGQVVKQTRSIQELQTWFQSSRKLRH